MARDDDLVGLVEIAQRLDVAMSTARMWKLRSQRGELDPPLPEPLAFVASGTPVYSWREVAAWARETSRLSEEETPR
jgi:hypothetical protein